MKVVFFIFLVSIITWKAIENGLEIYLMRNPMDQAQELYDKMELFYTIVANLSY